MCIPARHVPRIDVTGLVFIAATADHLTALAAVIEDRAAHPGASYEIRGVAPCAQKGSARSGDPIRHHEVLNLCSVPADGM